VATGEGDAVEQRVAAHLAGEGLREGKAAKVVHDDDRSFVFVVVMGVVCCIGLCI
jgi:hypothetical protein